MISKYIKLWLSWFKLEIEGDMAYRMNFLLHLIAGSIFSVISPLIMYFIYNSSRGIPGWSFWEIMLFVGTTNLVWGFCSFVFFPMIPICISYVQQGTFDRVMIRPFNPLGFLTFSSIELNEIGGLFVGVTLISTALIKLKTIILFSNIIYYIILIILALLFIYSLIVLTSAMCFIAVKNFGIHAFIEAIGAYTEYPLTIYGPTLNFVFTFILPVGIASFYPVSILLGKVGFSSIAIIALPVFAMFGFSLFIWSIAMKKYSSAGG